MKVWNPWTSNAEAYRFEYAYSNLEPLWDIGKPQPVFQKLESDGWISGEVLDIGCGTGDLSLYLKEKDYNVLGVDFSPTAVEEATQKSFERQIPVDFLVWDALKIEHLNKRFDTVVDSAMFHCLNSEQRKKFVEQLDKVVNTGGRYIVLFSPNNIPLTELDEIFSHWRLDLFAQTDFVNNDETRDAFIAIFRKY